MEKEEKKDDELPKDLGIVIENKDVVFWKRVQENAKKEIELMEQTIELNRELIIVAERRLMELKRRAQ